MCDPLPDRQEELELRGQVPELTANVLWKRVPESIKYRDQVTQIHVGEQGLQGEISGRLTIFIDITTLGTVVKNNSERFSRVSCWKTVCRESSEVFFHR